MQHMIGQIETVKVAGQELLLHPERVVFWPQEEVLFLTDLHLGKTSHFRRNGIALPSTLDYNLGRLDNLIDQFNPEKTIILGDLFHSVYNRAWETVIDFLQSRNNIEFILVEGNHDILDLHQYARAGITLAGSVLELEPFMLSHERIDDLPADRYCLHGHIHPGARLRGDGGQVLTLPCFIFGESAGVLPAFGAFTGLARQLISSSDRVFAVTEECVLKL